MERALIGIGVAACWSRRGTLQHIEELAERDGTRGLAEEAGAEADEMLVGVDLGLDLGEIDVADERVEGDVEVLGETREGEIGLEDVEDEGVRPSLHGRDGIGRGLCWRVGWGVGWGEVVWSDHDEECTTWRRRCKRRVGASLTYVCQCLLEQVLEVLWGARDRKLEKVGGSGASAA